MEGHKDPCCQEEWREEQLNRVRDWEDSDGHNTSFFYGRKLVNVILSWKRNDVESGEEIQRGSTLGSDHAIKEPGS